MSRSVGDCFKLGMSGWEEETSGTACKFQRDLLRGLATDVTVD